MQFPPSLAVIEMGFHGGAWVLVWYLVVLRKTYIVVRKVGGIFGSIFIPNLVPSNQSELASEATRDWGRDNVIPLCSQNHSSTIIQLLS
jgi:hypothetical protein